MVGSDINYAFSANTRQSPVFYFQNMCDLLSGAGGRAQPQGASVCVPGLAPEGLPLTFAKVCLVLSRRFAYFFREGLPLTFAKVCLLLSLRFASYFREGLPLTFAKVCLLLSRRFASYFSRLDGECTLADKAARSFASKPGGYKEISSVFADQ
jgi:hypothetical protein